MKPSSVILLALASCAAAMPSPDSDAVAEYEAPYGGPIAWLLRRGGGSNNSGNTTAGSNGTSASGGSDTGNTGSSSGASTGSGASSGSSSGGAGNTGDQGSAASVLGAPALYLSVSIAIAATALELV